MRLLVLSAALLAVVAATPAGASPAGPQIVDPTGDANFVNGPRRVGFAKPSYPATPGPDPYVDNPFADDVVTPAGSYDFADIAEVQWSTLKGTKKVRGRTVTVVTGVSVRMRLKAAPPPPDGTLVVYQADGLLPCTRFGPNFIRWQWYSARHGDANSHQSAMVDNCKSTPEGPRVTPIPPPTVSGDTITWNVPFSFFPFDTGVKVGAQISGLSASTLPVLDFKGVRVGPFPRTPQSYTNVTGRPYDTTKPNDTVFVVGS